MDSICVTSNLVFCFLGREIFQRPMWYTVCLSSGIYLVILDVTKVLIGRYKLPNLWGAIELKSSWHLAIGTFLSSYKGFLEIYSVKVKLFFGKKILLTRAREREWVDHLPCTQLTSYLSSYRYACSPLPLTTAWTWQLFWYAFMVSHSISLYSLLTSFSVWNDTPKPFYLACIQ